jgi:hypothetical protein
MKRNFTQTSRGARGTTHTLAPVQGRTDCVGRRGVVFSSYGSLRTGAKTALYDSPVSGDTSSVSSGATCAAYAVVATPTCLRRPTRQGGQPSAD